MAQRTINPDAYYTGETIQQDFGIYWGTTERAQNSGALKYSDRNGVRVMKGSDVQAWLDGTPQTTIKGFTPPQQQRQSGSSSSTSRPTSTSAATSPPVSTKGNDMTGTYAKQFHDIIDAKVRSGMRPDRARSEAAKEHPAIHKLALVEANQDRPNATRQLLGR